MIALFNMCLKSHYPFLTTHNTGKLLVFSVAPSIQQQQNQSPPPPQPTQLLAQVSLEVSACWLKYCNEGDINDGKSLCGCAFVPYIFEQI